MANRQNTLLLKRSNVIGKIPPISGLTLGEMALNTADAKLYSLYTSGSVSPTEVRQIGWDRISRTGDTVTGDFNIFGDVAISGSVLPNGYALTVTGDTDILGDLYVEGDIDYDGNLIVSGSGIFQSGLTANTIYTDYIDFNTGATVPQSVGRVSWDSGTGTLNIAVGDSGTGLIDLQVGQEEIVRVFNDEATTLQKGEIVYVSGSQGNRPRVKRALATSDGYSVTTLGMVDRNIASGAEGYVTTFGIISNLNTLGLTGGTPIWLSGTVPGGYTSTKPIAPLHTVLIGYVIRVDNNTGSIFVNISNGWELDEIHDVRISAATEGDLLVRSSFSGTPVWVNTKTLPGSYTITGNTNIGGNLTVSGTTFLKGLSATTISATTIGTSGDCIDDIYVSNIHSCSPLNINPLDEGNVYFGSTSGVTIDLSNNRVGIGITAPTAKLHINNTTSGNTFLAEDSSNPDSSPFVIDASGNTGIGTLTPSAKLQVRVNDFNAANGGFVVTDSGNTESYFTVSNVGQVGIRTPFTGSNFQFAITNTNPSFSNAQVRHNVSGDYAFSILDNQGYGFASSPSSININTRNTNGLINVWTQAGNTTRFNLGGQDINPTVARTRTIISPVNSSTTAFVPTGGTAIDYSFENTGNLAFQPTGGTATYTQIQLRPTYNATGTYSGTVRGLYYNPILTSLSGTTHRAIETTTGDVIFGSTSGNVGIGTTSPTAKLHINNTTSGNTFLAEDDTNPDSTPFVIDASGNTGIGTLTPREKLDVSGNTIISSGLTATTINVPPLADDKIVYTTNNGRLTTTSAFTYNQSNSTFSVNNIDANGNFNITGNTNQIGNFTITGNTVQSGNTTQVGNYHITGNTSQIGDSTMSGNTFITGNTNQIGNFIITGNTTQSGNTTQYGNIDLTGNTNQIGNFTITGNTVQSGNTTQVGNYNVTGNTDQLGYLHIVSATTGCTLAVTGNTCLDGDLDISGNTFMSGNFCMNNMNSTGQTGTNCLDTSLIPTGTTVIHQFQPEGGVLAHLGDLATGEPNSRGYTYFENNTTLTSFVAVGTGVYTPVIGAPQTVAGYNNLFTVTTGATTATTNKLTYNYPPATGTSFTYLKFTVSLSVELAQNQQLTFQIQRTRGVSVTTIPIGMSITPNGNTANGLSFNGIAEALHQDEFVLVVRNATGSGGSNSVRITDVSFSMFT